MYFMINTFVREFPPVAVATEHVPHGLEKLTIFVCGDSFELYTPRVRSPNTGVTFFRINPFEDASFEVLIPATTSHDRETITFRLTPYTNNPLQALKIGEITQLNGAEQRMVCHMALAYLHEAYSQASQDPEKYSDVIGMAVSAADYLLRFMRQQGFLAIHPVEQIFDKKDKPKDTTHTLVAQYKKDTDISTVDYLKTDEKKVPDKIRIERNQDHIVVYFRLRNRTHVMLFTNCKLFFVGSEIKRPHFRKN